MKVSVEWLNEFVDLSGIDIDDLCSKLTMSGLEVEGVDTLERMDNVVVGKVLECGKHPDADKLSLCKVTDGTEEFQVVCGAPNVAAGQTIPFAKVGAKLPGGFKIKKAKIRGTESFGMICSESELGLADKSDGIMPLPEHLEIGSDINEHLGLGDSVIDISITPNRADALSIIGVAREISALYGRPMKQQEISVQESGGNASDHCYVEVKNSVNCPAYLARVIKGVKIKPSPMWMQNRLRAAGVRPINNVVDITNYVLFEYGQPLHTFDLRMIERGIIVRDAKEGEEILTLDEKERRLESSMLVIADEKKPLAVAGVMGGEHSGINDDTTDVLLECAYFKPESIRMTARRLGMQTDSSYRFERGIDPESTVRMVDYAASLLAELCEGTVSSGVVSNNYELPKQPIVEFSTDKINDFLGTDIPEKEMLDILENLGMPAEKSGDIYRLSSPSWRVDIERWQDVAEEVARMYGYDNINATVPLLPSDSMPLIPILRWKRILQQRLASLGFNEAVNYSFMGEDFLSLFDDRKRFVKLMNPISEDMSTLRTYVFPGVISTIAHNIKHGVKNTNIFEASSVFIEEGGELPFQELRFAFGVSGGYWPLSWNKKNEEELFFVTKGVLDNIFSAMNVSNAEYVRGSLPFLHPGKSAEVRIDGETVAFLGELHPDVLEKLDIDVPVCICEILFEKLLDTANVVPRYKKFSKYPSVYKDISVAVPAKAASNDIALNISGISSLIDEVVLYDVYKGKGVDEGEVSLTFRIFFSDPEKTLTDEETNAVLMKIAGSVKEEFGAKLR
ncbi:phenylalanine--tRNA ligase subunit beta [Limisalsivibrio acetivorans]|uniref:phenylalanine--tRNA ligase subunit beta n=1 Tax=Limisalsivibrio acetivorans TaxID=1304888 RepID=UPI0003B333D9|nr:phenylalanine--tRNA ligase subunit beta [Limisalsivibrio acetivorans]